MSLQAHRVRHGYAEYLAIEERSAVRHEYLDGNIYAMAGGTPERATLAMALGVLLALNCALARAAPPAPISGSGSRRPGSPRIPTSP